MTKLPELPSDLIELALADLRKVEADERYAVDMHDWHSPVLDDNNKNVCSVCLAGAVMAGTLGYAPDTLVFPSETAFDRQLSALDNLRRGAIYMALDELEREYDGGVPDRWRVPVYNRHNPEPFHIVMSVLAQRLRELGH